MDGKRERIHGKEGRRIKEIKQEKMLTKGHERDVCQKG